MDSTKRKLLEEAGCSELLIKDFEESDGARHEVELTDRILEKCYQEMDRISAEELHQERMKNNPIYRLGHYVVDCLKGMFGQ